MYNVRIYQNLVLAVFDVLCFVNGQFVKSYIKYSKLFKLSLTYLGAINYLHELHGTTVHEYQTDAFNSKFSKRIELIIKRPACALLSSLKKIRTKRDMRVEWNVLHGMVSHILSSHTRQCGSTALGCIYGTRFGSFPSKPNRFYFYFKNTGDRRFMSGDIWVLSPTTLSSAIWIIFFQKYFGKGFYFKLILIVYAIWVVQCNFPASFA